MCVLGHCCWEVAAPDVTVHPDVTVLQLSRLPRWTQDAAPAQRQLQVPVCEHRASPRREPGRPLSRKGSSASASGLKKLLCSLSQSTKQRLGRFRCYSMEQLPAPGGSPPGGPGLRKSPSLQSLQLVSLDIAPRRGWHKGKDAGLG